MQNHPQKVDDQLDDHDSYQETNLIGSLTHLSVDPVIGAMLYVAGHGCKWRDL